MRQPTFQPMTERQLIDRAIADWPEGSPGPSSDPYHILFEGRMRLAHPMSDMWANWSEPLIVTGEGTTLTTEKIRKAYATAIKILRSRYYGEFDSPDLPDPPFRFPDPSLRKMRYYDTPYIKGAGDSESSASQRPSDPVI